MPRFALLWVENGRPEFILGDVGTTVSFGGGPKLVECFAEE